MLIRIKKLEKNGYVVDVDNDKGLINIYKPNGNHELFNALHKTMADYNVKHSGMKAEEMVMQINNEKIMDLCNDE